MVKAQPENSNPLGGVEWETDREVSALSVPNRLSRIRDGFSRFSMEYNFGKDATTISRNLIPNVRDAIYECRG